jgi:hypothetical protein
MFDDIGTESYSTTKNMCLQYIYKVLKANCKEPPETRKNKLYNLMEYFMLEMSKSSNNFLNHNLDELRDPKYIQALLCIVCSIYFFSNSLKC